MEQDFTDEREGRIQRPNTFSNLKNSPQLHIQTLTKVKFVN